MNFVSRTYELSDLTFTRITFHVVILLVCVIHIYFKDQILSYFFGKVKTFNNIFFIGYCWLFAYGLIVFINDMYWKIKEVL